MRLLILNAGSSSLKFRLFDVSGEDGVRLVGRGAVSSFGDRANCVWALGGRDERSEESVKNQREATHWVLGRIRREIPGRKGKVALDAVGHRVVHGGERYTETVRITDEVLSEIQRLSVWAPLHNPASLEVILACREEIDAKTPMAAVFDTAFFQSLPDPARIYALPGEWGASRGFKRYGFHGIAHHFLMDRYFKISGAERQRSRLISIQLGHGCSMTALRGETPVETSMGFTPLEGLIMATRSGDVDPGVLLHLALRGGIGLEELESGLNRRSGLLGLSGVSGDMRELLELEAKGHSGAHLAIEAFCHRVRKYLGAYLAVLGGVDAVLFGGGIGENAPPIRERICSGMEWCGLKLDPDCNQRAVGVEARIDTQDVRGRIYIIPVDEESIIARETYQCLMASSAL